MFRSYDFREASFKIVSMSLSKAKELLGLPPGSTPSESEITRAWRQKMFENHPDRGGDEEKAVEINIAKEVLEGKRSPSGEQSTTPGDPWNRPTTTRQRPEPQPSEVITFEEAKAKAGIPGDIDWMFVTVGHSSGYSSDEFRRYVTGWAAVGQTNHTYVCVAVEHLSKEDYFIGGGPSINNYSIKMVTSFGGTASPDPQVFTSLVTSGWRTFQWLEKKFNGKVVRADNWKFGDRLPVGHPTTIKNLLLDLGMVQEGKVARKFVVELGYEEAFSVRDTEPGGLSANKGFVVYKADDPVYGKAVKFTLVINSHEYILKENDTIKLLKFRINGKSLLRRVFGEYARHSRPKMLTKLRGDGKAILEWMGQNLHDLPSDVRDNLAAAAAQMKS